MLYIRLWHKQWWVSLFCPLKIYFFFTSKNNNKCQQSHNILYLVLITDCDWNVLNEHISAMSMPHIWKNWEGCTFFLLFQFLSQVNTIIRNLKSWFMSYADVEYQPNNEWTRSQLYCMNYLFMSDCEEFFFWFV